MQMQTISLSRETLSGFDGAIQREWILANGLGGYASSTALGMNTRKYHGLLVAAIHPPRDRRVLLEKLDEEITVGDNVYQLGTNEFQDRVFPSGYGLLSRFEISLFPKYVYSLQDVEVEKTIFMLHGKNVTIVLYKVLNRSGLGVRIRIFPLANCRHFHSVTDRRSLIGEPMQKCESNQTLVSFASPKSALIIGVLGGTYHPNERWVERLYYREEAKRGESCLDDWYQGGFFESEVRDGGNGDFAVVAVADEKADVARVVFYQMPETILDMKALFEKEKQQRESLVATFYEDKVSVQSNDWLSLMTMAADSLVVSGADPEHRSVIAGYHWFEDWGRDVFVSLPGLTLVTGRFEDARRILLTFKKRFSRGLIPNFIPDGGEPAVYNSVDATLWYVNAVFQYLKYTGDFTFVHTQLLEMLKSFVESLVKGATPNMRLDADGLLSHGPQLTWMDAVAEGQPVTPRAGKAVEVQALWYNTLRIMELLAKKFNEHEDTENYAKMAERTKTSFVEKFWNVERECLVDAIDGDRRDFSLRPNQVIAVSLNFTAFDQPRNKEIVDCVEHELLTPLGLRSLEKNDPRYVGTYAGDRRSRDLAYHNGTVWPWLLGPFTTAYLKVHGYDAVKRNYAYNSFLAPFFIGHVTGTQLGTASEIFDGDPPHSARGCILQAWSVAEPLRAYVEDVSLLRPKCEGIVQDLL
jgi:predicted glycogen debranching enzyme